MYKNEKHQSLGNKIKEDIVRMILSGKLKPGDRLKEVELSAQMGVSRIPVREALLLLEQEGFIESGPYKNNIVVGINLSEIINVFLPIRRTIEIYALREFLPIATEEHFKYLEYQIHQMEWALKADSIEQFVEADIKFHECLLQASGLKSLMSIWSSISNRMRMYFFASSQVLNGKLDEVVHGHYELLTYMRKKDLEGAEKKLLDHINDVVIGNKQV